MSKYRPLPSLISLALLTAAMIACLLLRGMIAWPFIAALAWAVTLAVWGIKVAGLIDNFINPILVGKRTALNPMLCFIAIAGGLALFGAHGIVFGLLVFAFARALLEIWRGRVSFEPKSVPDGS